MVIVVIVIVLVMSLVGFGYMYMQNPNFSKAVPSPVVSSTPLPSDSTVVTASSKPVVEETKTVVVYETEASFSTSDKSQIQARIVDPLIDYYNMEMDSPAVSIKIKINTAVNKADYPYLFEYILKNGVNGGGVITKTDGQINWWFPECLMSCDLSEEFTSKYPEIDALVE